MANRKAGLTLFLQLNDEIFISVTPDKIDWLWWNDKSVEIDLVRETCYSHGVYVLKDKFMKYRQGFLRATENLRELIWAGFD